MGWGLGVGCRGVGMGVVILGFDLDCFLVVIDSLGSGSGGCCGE